MMPGNQLAPYPSFYVMHGQAQPGQTVVVGTTAPGAAPGTAPQAVAGDGAAAPATTNAEGGVVNAAAGKAGLGQFLDPKAMVNSAVQGAVQGGINRALNN